MTKVAASMEQVKMIFFTFIQFQLSMLADFSEVQSIKVAREKENMNRVELTIKGEEPGVSQLSSATELWFLFLSAC